jgi:hypothetical protein
MEYEAFVADLKALSDGAEVMLTIRDLTPGRRKYNARIVRGIVSRNAGAASPGDVLWVRSIVGRKLPDPWSLQIVEELGATAPGRPYSDIYAAMEQLRPAADVAR